MAMADDTKGRARAQGGAAVPPRGLTLVGLALLAALAGGCASITNPVADGIPVNRLPDEVFGRPRSELRDIPLTWLRQPPADPYKLDAGDVLGIYVENVLGDRNQPIPARFVEIGNVPPSVGYPVPVQEDGTVVLPFIPPVKVAGLSLLDAQKAIKNAYVSANLEILIKGKEKILVTLMQPRRYHVLVVRQDSGGVSYDPNSNTLGGNRRGTGFALDLPAYENDVLNALAKSGGLPGLDAVNEVFVERGGPGAVGGAPGAGAPWPQVCQPGPAGNWPGYGGGQVIRIPLRMRPGEPPQFRPEDVVLKTGDIVFIPSRDTEVYYTAGLIPVGEWLLPRDYDLDVIGAIAKARGPLLNGGFNQANQFIGSVVPGGIGAPSPSLLIVLRKTATGAQIPIRVDLNKAFRDPRERILVKPGDILVLQEKPEEALGRYFTSVFRLNFLGQIIRTNDVNLTSTITLP